jgi:ABC-type sugar transport system ATPase subunit
VTTSHSAAGAGTRSGVPALALRGIFKSFGHVNALTDVDLDVWPGEVLALLGDNGAGKSTLVKIMSGLHAPDAGEIRVRGEVRHFVSPSHAQRAGVVTVYQDLALVEVLDVATNMFIGQVPTRHGLVDRRRMIRETEAFLASLNVTVASVRTPIGMLSGGQRQIIAIARALRRGADTVLLDEPTAALGVRETAQAADLIATLRDQGRAVILVTHDMELVFEIADRMVVLRLGRVGGTRPVADTDRDEIVGLITGSRTDVTGPRADRGDRP